MGQVFFSSNETYEARKYQNKLRRIKGFSDLLHNVCETSVTIFCALREKNQKHHGQSCLLVDFRFPSQDSTGKRSQQEAIEPFFPKSIAKNYVRTSVIPAGASWFSEHSDKICCIVCAPTV